jgi:hypothetical protein
MTMLDSKLNKDCAFNNKNLRYECNKELARLRGIVPSCWDATGNVTSDPFDFNCIRLLAHLFKLKVHVYRQSCWNADHQILLPVSFISDEPPVYDNKEEVDGGRQEVTFLLEFEKHGPQYSLLLLKADEFELSGDDPLQ